MRQYMIQLEGKYSYYKYSHRVCGILEVIQAD
jgi:hypothetical protein